MRLRLALAASLLALPAAAAERDVPWWVAHPLERRQVIRLCRDDTALAVLPLCRNAELAETRVYARRLASQGEMGRLDWWQRDSARWATLQANCRPGAPQSPTTRFCHLLGS